MPGLTGKLTTFPCASVRNADMSIPFFAQYFRKSGSRLLMAGQT